MVRKPSAWVQGTCHWTYILPWGLAERLGKRLLRLLELQMLHMRINSERLQGNDISNHFHVLCSYLLYTTATWDQASQYKVTRNFCNPVISLHCLKLQTNCALLHILLFHLLQLLTHNLILPTPIGFRLPPQLQKGYTSLNRRLVCLEILLTLLLETISWLTLCS